MIDERGRRAFRRAGARRPDSDGDRRYGLRLAVALVAAVVFGVPFLVLLLSVQAEWPPLLSADRTVADTLHSVALHHRVLVRALEWISIGFAPTTFRIAATLLAGWLIVRRRPRLALWALVTTWGAALLGVVAKAAVNRARPSFVHAVATAGGRSFPSVHALGSVVGCGVLLLVLLPLLARPLRWLAWTLAAVVTAAVGFARIGLGVHYLSDVLAGWLLGLAWLAATAAAFQAWRRDVGGPASPPADGLEPELAEEGMRTNRPG